MHNKDNYELEIVPFQNKNESDPNFPNGYYPINAPNLLLMQNNVNEYGQLIQDDLRKDEEKISNLTTYSLDEINTGIKWVDGNDIYKKTIYISSLPNATTNVYDTTITNMQEFIYLYGRASGGLIVNGVRPDSRELEIGAWYDETQDKIRVATGIDRRSIAAYITIIYTKATDEVVSNE